MKEVTGKKLGEVRAPRARAMRARGERGERGVARKWRVLVEEDGVVREVARGLGWAWVSPVAR